MAYESHPSPALDAIASALRCGEAVPYIGPGVIAHNRANTEIPHTTAALAARVTAKNKVPHKIAGNLSAAAQFIENFKHRKTLASAMSEAFGVPGKPTQLHSLLLAQCTLPLVVHTWYDALPCASIESRKSWGVIQGVSQAEHRDGWFHRYQPDGTRADADAGKNWTTLLYQPLGSVWPAQNYLVSDSDFVEVLTEIDIQTPIPPEVQERRMGRSFLFLGCRFDTQIERQFARQIIKRSSGHHWAVLPEQPTKNEQRFMDEYGIERVDIDLSMFVEAMVERICEQPA